MINALLSRLAIVVFGTLYPAYSSYKALKTKNSRALVKWIMYWIVYAFFTAVETFTDMFLSWFPMYYEGKVLFIIWLLSPATKGTSYIYRKFVHPNLEKHETDIDKYISEASKKGAETLINVGAKSLNLCASTVLCTAIQGQDILVDKLRKSYSASDISRTNTLNENRLLETLKEQDGDSDDDDLAAGIFSEKSENLMHPFRPSGLGKVPENSEPEVFKSEVRVMQKPKPFNRSVSAPINRRQIH